MVVTELLLYLVTSWHKFRGMDVILHHIVVSVPLIHERQGNTMALDPNVKDNWESLQEKYNVPVDALGRPIDQNDTETLNVWKNEGIDQFLQK